MDEWATWLKRTWRTKFSKRKKGHIQGSAFYSNLVLRQGCWAGGRSNYNGVGMRSLSFGEISEEYNGGMPGEICKHCSSRCTLYIHTAYDCVCMTVDDALCGRHVNVF